MPYLIESDVLIAHRERQPSAVALLAQLAPHGLAISVITYLRVYQGILRNPDPAAATALEHHLELVTRNITDVADIPAHSVYRLR